MLESTEKNNSRPRCRFDLFVNRKKEFIRPGESQTWCHRGDKYTDDPPKMLCSLLRMVMNHKYKWTNAELYDNTKPVDDQSRVILKIINGNKVVVNRLNDYAPMLTTFPAPDYLRNNYVGHI